MDFFVSPEWNQQILDDNGNPAFGWKIYTYIAGSTTPIDTFTDATGTTANPNPIILPADGRYEMWLEQDVAYKIVLTDENDVSQKTVDNVVGGIQGSGGGGLDFVSVAQSDTISLEGLGTVTLPLTANVNISSLTGQAITVTTGGIYAKDYGIEISDLETAVANKLDKVDPTPQSVVSIVDILSGIKVIDGYLGPSSPQIVVGVGNDAYLWKIPSGDFVMRDNFGNNDGIFAIRDLGGNLVRVEAAAGLSSFSMREGDGTNQSIIEFTNPDGGAGARFILPDNIPDDNIPVKIYGRDASGQMVQVDPSSIGSVAWGDITGTLSNQTDLQAALDAKLDANDPSLTNYANQITSGVNTGLEVTQASPTQIQIAVGTGYSIDRTDPNDVAPPSIVTVASPRVETIPFSDGAVFLYLDGSGTFIPLLGRDPERKYLGLISLGAVIMVSGIIVEVVSNPNLAFSPYAASLDMAQKYGVVRDQGKIYLPTGTLNIGQDAGEYLALGRNFNVNPNNPNIVELGASALKSFAMTTPLSATATPVTVVDVNQWFNPVSGLLEPFPSNRYGTYRVYMAVNGNLFVLYPQEIYNSQAAALDAYLSGEDTFVNNPFLVDRANAIHMADFVTGGAVLNLDNADFRHDNEFGLGGGGGGGGTNAVWGSITGNIADQTDLNLQSLTDNGPTTTNALTTGDLTISTPAGTGEALKIPDFSWIRPTTVGTGFYLTNTADPNPNAGSSIHLDGSTTVYAGDGFLRGSMQARQTGGVLLAGYNASGILQDSIQLNENDIQILTPSGTQVIANATDLTLQGPATQSLNFSSAGVAQFANIPTGTPIQDPVESYYYFESPTGEMQKTTAGVFKALAQVSDTSATNVLSMSFVGGAGGKGTLFSSDLMDIQSIGAMNIFPAGVVPTDGQVLVYRTASGGLVYEAQAGGATPDLQDVTDVGNLTDNPLRIQNTTASFSNGGFVHLRADNTRYSALVTLSSATRLIAGANGAEQNDFVFVSADASGVEGTRGTFAFNKFELNDGVQVRVDPSSVGTPSIASRADVNSGFNWLSNDVIQGVTGGSERIRLTNTGLIVGGATDDLVHALQVDGGATFAGSVSSITFGPLGNQIRYDRVGASYHLFDATSGALIFGTSTGAGDDYFRINSDRSVVVPSTGAFETPKIQNVPTGTPVFAYGEDVSGDLVKAAVARLQNYGFARYFNASLFNGLAVIPAGAFPTTDNTTDPDVATVILEDGLITTVSYRATTNTGNSFDLNVRINGVNTTVGSVPVNSLKQVFTGLSISVSAGDEVYFIIDNVTGFGNIKSIVVNMETAS